MFLKVISKLHSILNPFLLRRLKTDVEIALVVMDLTMNMIADTNKDEVIEIFFWQPPKKEYVVYAEMSQLQRKISKGLLTGIYVASW